MDDPTPMSVQAALIGFKGSLITKIKIEEVELGGQRGGGTRGS